MVTLLLLEGFALEMTRDHDLSFDSGHAPSAAHNGPLQVQTIIFQYHSYSGFKRDKMDFSTSPL